MGNVSEMEAIKKWNALPEEFRKRIIENVYCSNCGVTAIAPSYTITQKKRLGILLNGKCTKCGHDVCRVIED